MPISNVGSSTNAPGYEIDYAQITATATITSTNSASPTNVVSGASISYDGQAIVLIEFQCYSGAMDADTTVVIALWDGSTDLGRYGLYVTNDTNAGTDAMNVPVRCARRLTPSTGAHQYHVKAYKSGGGNASLIAGAGGTDTALPAFMRITRV